MSIDRDTQTEGELERLRAEVERTVDHLHVEARGLRESTLLHRRNTPVADALDGIADALDAALHPAPPAASPDSASTGDTCTRAGLAPSESHSEAQGKHWCFDCAPLDGGA